MTGWAGPLPLHSCHSRSRLRRRRRRAALAAAAPKRLVAAFAVAFLSPSPSRLRRAASSGGGRGAVQKRRWMAWVEARSASRSRGGLGLYAARKSCCGVARRASRLVLTSRSGLLWRRATRVGPTRRRCCAGRAYVRAVGLFCGGHDLWSVRCRRHTGNHLRRGTVARRGRGTAPSCPGAPSGPKTGASACPRGGGGRDGRLYTAGASLEALHAAVGFGGPSSHVGSATGVFASIAATDLAEAHCFDAGGPQASVYAATGSTHSVPVDRLLCAFAGAAAAAAVLPSVSARAGTRASRQLTADVVGMLGAPRHTPRRRRRRRRRRRGRTCRHRPRRRRRRRRRAAKRSPPPRTCNCARCCRRAAFVSARAGTSQPAAHRRRRYARWARRAARRAVAAAAAGDAAAETVAAAVAGDAAAKTVAAAAAAAAVRRSDRHLRAAK